MGGDHRLTFICVEAAGDEFEELITGTAGAELVDQFETGNIHDNYCIVFIGVSNQFICLV